LEDRECLAPALWQMTLTREQSGSLRWLE
jgi:hypothetical protein